MAYRVLLFYFRPTGKFLAHAETDVEREKIEDIWDEVHELRRMGRLPGLRPNAGRDLFILVDVIFHPERTLRLIMPPFVNEEDITPIRVSTGEMQPLVRVPLDEIPGGRTTTRDVVKIEPVHSEPDDEVTPVDKLVPAPPDE